MWNKADNGWYVSTELVDMSATKVVKTHISGILGGDAKITRLKKGKYTDRDGTVAIWRWFKIELDGREFRAIAEDRGTQNPRILVDESEKFNNAVEQAGFPDRLSVWTYPPNWCGTLYRFTI